MSKTIKEKFKAIFLRDYCDDAARRRLMFRLLSLVLALISFVMSVMNIFTGELVLLYVTAIYSLSCLINLALSWWKLAIIQTLFILETVAMLSFFVITGIPAGFSVLWTLVIPACALYIFGGKRGSALSIATFLMIIFFFWTPVGKQLLVYNYSPTFMMRFPLVYVCLYLISFYVEWIRLKTFKRMVETEEKYHRLYRHDALTGIYSRYAFYEEVEKLCASRSRDEAAVLMVDIDDFKAINDRFGHSVGDDVLRRVAAIILESTCEHCLSCRWGGEEFLVVMKCEHDPVMVAECIRTRTQETWVADQTGAPVRFTVSVGVSLGSIADRELLAGQINRADGAMYDSKHRGKNRTTLLRTDGSRMEYDP